MSQNVIIFNYIFLISVLTYYSQNESNIFYTSLKCEREQLAIFNIIYRTYFCEQCYH